MNGISCIIIKNSQNKKNKKQPIHPFSMMTLSRLNHNVVGIYYMIANN